MKLKLNDYIEIEVIELISGGSCIVNIDGSLMRVQSQLDSRPKPGDRLQVKVVALSPLKFQTIKSSVMGFNVEI